MFNHQLNIALAAVLINIEAVGNLHIFDCRVWPGFEIDVERDGIQQQSCIGK